MKWLRERKMAGAALGLFETVPLPAGHPPTALPNAPLTSHCASMTPDSKLIGLAITGENIQNFPKGTPSHDVVGPKG